MTALETLALSNAQGLHNMLGHLYDLPQNGPGSCVEQAWNLMEVVVWYLDPHPEGGMPARRGPPGDRDKGEILLMLEAGVSVPDCARYFGAAEAAVQQLLGDRRQEAHL